MVVLVVLRDEDHLTTGDLGAYYIYATTRQGETLDSEDIKDSDGAAGQSAYHSHIKP